MEPVHKGGRAAASTPGASEGWVEAIGGPMFAGKTGELILRLRRAAAAGKQVQAFRPLRDTRHLEAELRSHGGLTWPAQRVADAGALACAVRPTTALVGIDEGQFFDADLAPAVLALAAAGRDVVVAGLDLDADGQPFVPMPAVMAVADAVTKVTATCAACGAPAQCSLRRVAAAAQVLVGGAEAYEPRCRPCHRQAVSRAATG